MCVFLNVFPLGSYYCSLCESETPVWNGLQLLEVFEPDGAAISAPREAKAAVPWQPWHAWQGPQAEAEDRAKFRGISVGSGRS